MARIDLPLPSLPETSPAVANAFDAALTKHATVEAMAKRARALGAALANDAAATAKLHAEVRELALTLARLGPLQELKNKALRATAYERQSQLEMLTYGLRLAGPENDAALASLAQDVPDGRIRGTLVDALSGGQISLPAGALAEVAAFFDLTADRVVMRCAIHAAFSTDPAAAQRCFEAVLRAAPTASADDVSRVVAVLAALESQPDHEPWAPLVYPLTTHAAPAIASHAGGFVAKRPTTFLGYLAWAASQPHSASVIHVISEQAYWATLAGLRNDALATPLGTLLARATKTGDTASADTLTRALRKLGVEVAGAAKAPSLGAPLAQIGTEGGPPMVVPAVHLAAWRGVAGPRPFGNGGSDYERACDPGKPHLLVVGEGAGVVLGAQGCDVHAIDGGLLFIAGGRPDEEVASAWKRLGALAVAAGGVVVLDSAEVGAEPGTNRQDVELPAGTYDVWSHRPQGFGGDYEAVKLLRSTGSTASVKPASTAKAKSAATTKTAKKTAPAKSPAKPAKTTAPAKPAKSPAKPAEKTAPAKPAKNPAKKTATAKPAKKTATTKR